MKQMKADSAKCAIVRPVPDSYDNCIRTNNENTDVRALQPKIQNSRKMRIARRDYFIFPSGIVTANRHLESPLSTLSKSSTLVDSPKIVSKAIFSKPPLQ